MYSYGFVGNSGDFVVQCCGLLVYVVGCVGVFLF